MTRRRTPKAAARRRAATPAQRQGRTTSETVLRWRLLTPLRLTASRMPWVHGWLRGLRL